MVDIFISWSGSASKELASSFRDWIPLVLQNATPFMSSKDIKAGELWNTTINERLQDSSIGIIFVTPENIDSPWLNFESGALSRGLNDTGTKVVPVVFGTDDPAYLLSNGPLKQFQGLLKVDRSDFIELIDAINDSDDNMKLNSTVLHKTFDKWWPEFKDKIDKIDQNFRSRKKPPKKDSNEEAVNRQLLEGMSEKVDFLIRRNNVESLPKISPKLLQPTVDLVNAYETLVHSFILIPRSTGLIREFEEPISYFVRQTGNDMLRRRFFKLQNFSRHISRTTDSVLNDTETNND
ncbi:toll/interleukin-1 receptor domain-containing protein [Oenococcus sicerae]|uniref:toll/interleukin-1 receptor domain-containing protein n=1 Tax=Oenococcus sicerae TaxID=2203724 RepID=UPI0039E99B90